MTIGTPQGTPTSVGLATDVLWNATGDIAVATGDNTASIVPIGANYTIIGKTTGSVEWRTLDGGSP